LASGLLALSRQPQKDIPCSVLEEWSYLATEAIDEVLCLLTGKPAVSCLLLFGVTETGATSLALVPLSQTDRLSIVSDGGKLIRLTMLTQTESTLPFHNPRQRRSITVVVQASIDTTGVVNQD